MPRKHRAKPESINSYFEPDIIAFCSTHNIAFGSDEIALLWLIAISDGRHNFASVIKEGIHFDFFSIYCASADECLKVLVKMRQLFSGLSQEKRLLLARDHSEKTHNESAGELNRKHVLKDAEVDAANKRVAEAHEQISNKQELRRRKKVRSRLR